MKTIPWHSTILTVALALAWAVSSEATVTFVGNDLVTGPAWRTSASAKPNDLDGDNVYGTAGYYLAAGLRAGYEEPWLTDNVITGASNDDDINTLPAYLTSFEFTDPAQHGRSWGGSGGNFGTLDNVGGGHTGMTGRAILITPGGAGPMSLTLKRNSSPDFRLTLIIGSANEGGFDDPAGQNVTVDDGSGAVTRAAPTPGFSAATTYQSWDITAGSSDITIVMEGLPAGVGVARLSGLAVDIQQVVPPTIAAAPVGGLFLTDVPLVLTVNASGTVPLTYEWFKDDVRIPSATTASLDLSPLADTDAGTYQVIVSNAGGSVTSAPVAVTVTADLPIKLLNYITEVETELSIFAWYPFDFLTADDLTTAYNGTLAGQTSFGTGVGGGADKALLLTGAGHVNIGTNAAFEFLDGTGTVEAWVRADWDTNALPGYNPALFAARNVNPTTTRWSLHMDQLKNRLAFWNGAAVSWVSIPDAGTDWHLYATVFDNDEWRVYWDGQLVASNTIPLGTTTNLPTQLGSAIEGSTAEGWIGALDEVVFFSDPLSGEALASHFNAFAAGDPPVILTQPQGGEFLVGSPVGLSVAASGPSLNYQWFHDGMAITDATNNTLTIASIAEVDAGVYTVTVSNETAVVTSDDAVVVVLVPDVAGYQAGVSGTPGLISYYTFDAGTADDVVSTNNGTLVGSTAFGTGIGGGADQALSLTGGHVGFGEVESFDFTNGVGTVEAWIRADWTALPGYNPTIFADRDGGPVNWSIHLLKAKDQLVFWNGGAASRFPVSNVGQSWHHLAVVFNAGTWTVIWDGQSLGTQTLPLGASPLSPTQLGSASAAGQETWPGTLDEVAFYSTALSESVVQKHFQSLTSAVLSFEAAGDQLLISWTRAGYKLQENPDVTDPNGWTDVANGDTSPVTVTIGTGNKFYRLVQVQ